MSDPTQLTETGIENLRFFVKFLANNNLIDDAYNRLQAKGITKLRISIEVVKEIQEMIKENSAQIAGGPDRAARAVIESAHNNNV
jgi:hypothetical protein